MRHAFLLAILALATACGGSDRSNSSVGSASDQDRSPEGNRTAKELSYIDLNEGRIKQKLKDPESATFRNSRVYYAVAPMVCGEVNARNSFGGKNGYQRFISGGEIQVLEEEMAAGEMDKTWNQICR